MPASSFPEYARELEDVLDTTIAAGEAVLVNIQIDQRSSLRGFITGLPQFNNSSELHFREFVDTNLPEPRLMYAYHYQNGDQRLVFRYDNAAHRPVLPQPEHKHTPTSVSPSSAPTLAVVVGIILREAHS